MKIYKNIRVVFLTIIMLIIGNKLYGKWEVPITSSKVYAFGTTTTFPTAVDATFYSFVASNPGTWQNTYNNHQIINRVVLGIDKNITTTYYTAFTVKVTVDITTRDEANVAGPSYTRELIVTYDPTTNTIENSTNIFEFTGALQVDMTVTAITDGAGTPLTNVQNNVYLESFIQVNRFQVFNPIVYPTLSTLTYQVGEYDEKTISISSIPGAESFDVEWMFIDKYSSLPATSPYEKFEYDFGHNGTRLTTTTSTITIPMIYQEGIILFRVRANGVTNLSDVSTFESGDWSTPESGELFIDFTNKSNIYTQIGPTVASSYSFFYDGYELGLNWQRQASFAEDGKFKQVVSYYDGILRDRQSITKNNSENVPIVAQKIYDFVGRAAIEVLPVPDPDNLTMKLRIAFNTSADVSRSGKSYNYKDFDIDAQNACVFSKTNKMDALNGAAKYYSPNNSLSALSSPSAEINKELIPDAEGYPFIQTEFTPDNTGRIARQGGVGSKHRLRGYDENNNLKIDWRETRYFYSSPFQEELDRLFANEVGNALHYKKQIVVDANGQHSVSYLDPQGRVIATALAGDPANSPNMMPLDNAATRTINVDLENKNIVLATERSVNTYATFRVLDDNTEYTFDYTLTAPQLTEACLPVELCFDCIYNLELSIKDECNVEYVPLADRKQRVGTIDNVCGSVLTFATNAVDYVINLPKGNYTVSKKLTIDNEALEYYKAEFLANNTCLKTYQEFLEEERNNLDFENCDYTCDKCNADLAAMVAGGLSMSSQEYLDAKAGCDELCETKTPCYALLEMIKLDMSPGGQYYNNIDNAVRVVDPELDDPFLSVDYSWLDANITPTQKTQIFTDIQTNHGVTVNSWGELEDKWEPEFADYLIQYHPEYCYYETCSLYLEPSYKYDIDMLNTESWLDAKNAGYYNPLGTDLTSFTLTYKADYTSNTLDPFFLLPDNTPARKNSMEGDLTEYINDPGYTDPENSAWKAMELAMAELGAKSCFNDHGWAMFRAMYLGEKQKYYKEYYTSKCTTVTIAADFTPRLIFDAQGAKDITGDTKYDELINKTDPTATITSSITTECNTICTNYADRWMEKLATCVFVSQAQEDDIRDHFIEICKKGCDINNPVGSRNISPTESYDFSSFKEVLEAYGLYDKLTCTDLLIEWPREYGHDYFAELDPYSDQCACETDKSVKDLYCPIDGPELTDCRCDDPATTELGKQTLIGADVDEQYKCKNCIDCYAFNAELKKFFDEYSSTLSTTDEILFNSLITNFLNLNLGFNLEFEDYALFAATCLNEELLGYDATSFYRLSLLNHYYRYGSDFIESNLNCYLMQSPYNSDVRLVSDHPQIYSRPIVFDNTDKSTWLASIAAIPYLQDKKAHGPSNTLTASIKVVSPEPETQKATTNAGVQCNCNEILRAQALYQTGRIRASSAQMAFQVLMGYTYTDYNTKLIECCNYYKGGSYDPTCSFTDAEAENFLTALNGGSVSYSVVTFPSATFPSLSNDFIDASCPIHEGPCHVQAVTLDQCGCENLFELKKKFIALNGQSAYDDPDEVPFINFVNGEYGTSIPTTPALSLPYKLKDLTEQCEKFFQTGLGQDISSGADLTRGSNIPNTNPPPATIPDWDQSALDDLNETAYDDVIDIPRILSCHPYCDRSVANGPPQVVVPKTHLPEPAKCKLAQCCDIVGYYQEFLDSMGIPNGGQGDPPLLPAELSSEFSFIKFNKEYQKDKSTANYPTIAAWAGYFPGGTTTQQMFDQINASITTKLVAAGFCHIESQRPFGDPVEGDNYFLSLLHCLSPVSYDQNPCGVCFDDDGVLRDMQKWLNRLARNDLKVLHKNNIPYYPNTVTEFYNEPDFYPGSNPQGVVQNVWSAKVPTMFLDVDEGVNEFDLFLLYSDGAQPKYNWRYVKKFYEIEPVLDKDCGFTNMFKIKAKIEIPKRYRTGNPNCSTDPDLPCEEEAVIYGFVDAPVNLFTSNYTLLTCPPCSTLCNRPFIAEPDTADPCRLALDDIAEDNALTRYNEYIEKELKEFEERYIAKCLQPIETFTMSFTDYEYHYTLYYYDQADNLIKTVPPAGVTPLTVAQVTQVKDHRNDPITNPTRITPSHTLITNYKYNTLNELAEQTTPDGGTSQFWYDNLGRLVLSQNAKQAAVPLVNNEGLYSYTQYDDLGRITEVGEIRIDPANVSASNIAANIATTLTAQQTTKTQITRTVYEEVDITYTGSIHPHFEQNNTRNRVVHSIYMETWNATNTNYNHATHYSYDMLGNVNQVVQDFPELAQYESQYKLIEYKYDLASGNVNMVLYQPTDNTQIGNDPYQDRFYHYYEYDADNRITNVYTSKRPAVEYMDFRQNRPNISVTTGWSRDAKYFYYAHGPQSRYEIGEEKVQGVDYANTIHGWLKSINSGIINAPYDPGRDGDYVSPGANQFVGRDAFGMELDYYNGDYTSILPTAHLSDKTSSDIQNHNIDLFNGNISRTITSIPNITQWQSSVLVADASAKLYRYDQLNRIKTSRYYNNFNIVNNNWGNAGTVPDQYHTAYTYDPMGNILSLERNGNNAQLLMDNLNYTYIAGTNKLEYVTDDPLYTPNYLVDIDNQNANNYEYDDIGNLIKDDAEEIQNIEWTVHGKIKKITRTIASTKPDLEFEYDATGQRVVKKVIPKNTTDGAIIDYYVHDASGNILAIYQSKDIETQPYRTRTFNQTEIPLYGSRRIGVVEEAIPLAEITYTPTQGGGENILTATIIALAAQNDTFSLMIGYKKYELTNHLGNVFVTISDRKLAQTISSAIDYYNPDVTTITDYYPFGMAIPDKQWSAAERYRFGFNGQEKENEVSGNDGDYLSFKYRMHDARLGRFLSVDPLFRDYPWNSTYAFSENRVIDSRELEGLERVDAKSYTYSINRAANITRYDASYRAGWVKLKNTNDDYIFTGVLITFHLILDGENKGNYLGITRTYGVGSSTGLYQYQPQIIIGSEYLDSYRTTVAESRSPWDFLNSDFYIPETEPRFGEWRWYKNYLIEQWTNPMNLMGLVGFRNVSTGIRRGVGNGVNASRNISKVKGIISNVLRKQKQAAEHVKGGARLGSNSYVNSIDDANKVLEAANNGTAKVLSTNTSQNRAYVEFDGVTGYYNNNGTIIETNKFLIKGGKSSTVVPIHPNTTTFK